jgi:hypothetical protein
VPRDAEIDTNLGNVTESDFRPYLELEAQHQDLFLTRHIQPLSSFDSLQLGTITDVDMDDCEFLIPAADRCSSLGTQGLATCVAVCARGKDAAQRDIMGLWHYSGEVPEAREVLLEMDGEMKRRGAVNTTFYLAGGLITTQEDEGGSYETEKNLLALRNEFDIQGAKLHLSKGEVDPRGEPKCVHLVMTPQAIYYSKQPY